MSERTPDPVGLTEYLERMIARGFVIAGGLFWMVAAFAGPYVFGETSLIDSVKTAGWPLLATIVILVIGWTYERLAAVLLFGATAAVVVWGTLYEWEMGVWVIMTFVLIAPMLIAAVLFLLSTHAETERSLAAEPQPAPRRRAFAPQAEAFEVASATKARV